MRRLISSRDLLRLCGLIFCMSNVVPVLSELQRDECEVCFGIIEKFSVNLSEEHKKDHKLIEEEFKKFCKGAKNRENRFCYYLGGLEESATGILSELSKPLTYSLPVHKICEKLKRKDAQICDLRYEKVIDFKTVDLRKLKVRELKNILSNWDEECDGCIEKSDFINRIEELKPKYVREEL